MSLEIVIIHLFRFERATRTTSPEGCDIPNPALWWDWSWGCDGHGLHEEPLRHLLQWWQDICAWEVSAIVNSVLVSCIWSCCPLFEYINCCLVSRHVLLWKKVDGEWLVHVDIFNTNVKPGQSPEAGMSIHKHVYACG